MNNRYFLRRLRKELPAWVARGWVAPDARQKILEQVARGGADRFVPPVMSILGTLFVGAGVVGLLAAHWAAMAGAVKAVVLVVALALSVAVTVVLGRRDVEPWWFYTALYLSVGIFGVDVLLFAQLAQVELDYARWALLWATGTLAAALVIRSQATLVAALLISVVWTAFASLIHPQGLHWTYLLFWGLCVGFALVRHWRFALHIAMLAFIAWSGLSLRPIELLWTGARLIHLLQFYFLMYFALFLVGMVMATYTRYARFSSAVQRYGVLASLLSFYLLTFPALHHGMSWGLVAVSRQPAPGSMIMVTGVAAAVVMGLVVWHRFRTGRIAGRSYLAWGQGVFVAPILLLLVNLFVSDAHADIMATGFNLVFFAGVAWVIFAGIEKGDRFFVNIGFTFLLLGLVARYLDTFWNLAGRAYFLMLGGLVLVTFGFVMENQRRKLTARILARRDAAMLPSPPDDAAGSA